MKVKCEYCGQFIQDTEDVCPHCGAPNAQAARSAAGVPRTIPELQAFCAAKKLPLETMRFFLGADYQGPRAFGIYQDEEGQFVVYKNKADGSRAVRYRGTDEAYAVNEIYQKLKSEIASQRSLQASRRAGTRSPAPARRTSRKKKRGLAYILGMIFVTTIFVMAVSIVLGGIAAFFDKTPETGYYSYNDSYYYNQNDRWYLYDDDYDAWTPVTVDEELQDHFDDYYETSYYSSGYGVSDFSDSVYYEEPSYHSYGADDDWESDNDWSTDWDDDDDWDWGGNDWDTDWDVGGTDWDSDW